nr:hypothetical protein [Mimivirus sp.]
MSIYYFYYLLNGYSILEINYLFITENKSKAKNKLKNYLDKNETILNELINKYISDYFDSCNNLENINCSKINKLKIKMFNLILNDIYEKINNVSKSEHKFIGHARLEYDTGTGNTDYNYFNNNHNSSYSEEHEMEKILEKMWNKFKKKTINNMSCIQLVKIEKYIN